MTETPKITRRRAVELAGAAGAAAVLSGVKGPGRLLDAVGLDEAAQAATSSCILTPAKTEGSYFVDEKLNRSDIRSDPGEGSVEQGVPLTLTLVVVRADGECAPVPGAVVDVWHANAGGLYSDESANGTSGRRFLRGYRVTGDDGAVTFTTIYPGWYSGRAIHIHYKVRLFDGSSETYEFTSQLFFDPAVSAAVVRKSEYSSRGTPDTSNASDGIYGSDGEKLLVPLTRAGSGYAGTFVVGLTGLRRALPPQRGRPARPSARAVAAGTRDRRGARHALRPDAGQGGHRTPAPRHAPRRADAAEQDGGRPGARHGDVPGRGRRIQDGAPAHHDPEAEELGRDAPSSRSGTSTASTARTSRSGQPGLAWGVRRACTPPWESDPQSS